MTNIFQDTENLDFKKVRTINLSLLTCVQNIYAFCTRVLFCRNYW